MRYTGTKSIGIRMPIFKSGDDVAEIVFDGIKNAVENGEITLKDRDIVGITESVVARSQGNYVSIDDIAESIDELYPDIPREKRVLGVVFPILSRNRFSIILKGIAKSAKKVIVLFKLPDDEVGNILINDYDKFNPSFKDVGFFREGDVRKFFKETIHTFTGVDYIDFYKSIINEVGAEAEIIVSENPEYILDFTDNVICCDIHTVDETYRRIANSQKYARTFSFKPERTFRLCNVCGKKNDKTGYNEDYGVLGSNKATETTLKLFPRNCFALCEKLQNMFKEKMNKHIEVFVYGDGAFKDPVCGIWELADPVASPGYTEGLAGTPNELKLKYLADNDFKNENENVAEKIKDAIKNKKENLFGNMASQGTTPRRYTDLLASLCDLTSGSGDKGTPVVLVQGYFDNFAD